LAIQKKDDLARHKVFRNKIMTIKKTNLLKTAGANFSECERYRYLLWRCWDESLPGCTFIMLNPSTADESASDPTITRCIEFAKLWGFGKIYVVNLFAWRSTDPGAMMVAEDPIGPENDFWITHACLNAPHIVCAWGNHGGHRNRSLEIMKFIELRKKVEQSMPYLTKPSPMRAYALKVNKTGQPAHPLYQPYSKELIAL